jgi:hypothetical protein
MEYFLKTRGYGAWKGALGFVVWILKELEAKKRPMEGLVSIVMDVLERWDCCYQGILNPLPVSGEQAQMVS